jgi:16S rRNA U516 pseudouridylate synthase RsuA-like enzyme
MRTAGAVQRSDGPDRSPTTGGNRIRAEIAKNASESNGKMDNNLKIEITQEKFEQIDDPGQKLNIIFSAVLVMQKQCGAVCQENDRKFKKLFRRKKVETTAIAASGGVVYFLWGWFKTKIGGGE